MGNIEIMTKLSRSKSVSSIDNDYLEAVTGDFLKIFCNIYRKTPVSGSLFDKIVGLQVC